jgi:hypothetical protein
MFGAVPPKEWYIAATETEDQATFLFETEKGMAMLASQSKEGR